MRTIKAIALLTAVTQSTAKDLEADEAEGHFAEAFLEGVTAHLLDRPLSESHPRKDFDSTALAKSGHLVRPAARASQVSVSSGDPSETLRLAPRSVSFSRPNVIANGLSEHNLAVELGEQAAAPSLDVASPRTRREALMAGTSLALGLAGAVLPAALPPPLARAEDSKMVGAYMPESKIAPGLYEFDSGQGKTPALRAGNLAPYRFSMPADWKEVAVANARSGNYCQPRCDEATTEVLFGSPKDGNMQVIVIPTTKLFIQKANPTIEDVGSKEGVLNSIGPAITGSVPVEQEDVESIETLSADGKTYYLYSLLTPDAIYGLHNVACVTTNKNYVVIGCISASEKQWSKSQDTLKQVVKSFRVNAA